MSEAFQLSSQPVVTLDSGVLIQVFHFSHTGQIKAGKR